MKKIRVFLAVALILGTLSAETISANQHRPKRYKKRFAKHAYPRPQLGPDTALLKAVQRLDLSAARLNLSTKKLKP